MNLNNDDEIFLSDLIGDVTPEDTPKEAPNIWRWPLVLGVMSAVGLICALIGDGAYDILSWCFLSWPLIVIARAMR